MDKPKLGTPKQDGKIKFWPIPSGKNNNSTQKMRDFGQKQRRIMQLTPPTTILTVLKMDEHGVYHCISWKKSLNNPLNSGGEYQSQVKFS